MKCCQCGREDVSNTGICVKCLELNWIQSREIKEALKHEI